MEFRVLGPIEALVDGEKLDLGAKKQRSLLALLLMNANRVVSTDRILEELWGDDAEGKENALWVYVSRLRSVLDPDRTGGEGVLVTKDHGYSLEVEHESIDAHHFETLIREGGALLRDDPAKAADVFAEALSLWRGSPFEDFAYDEFAQGEIVRLEELRLQATEDRIEADLRRGLAGELVGELELLHRDHPTQERIVGQLMLALYRAGRQAEALRTFERFRRGLGEEMGLEPSPELRRLEEQILLHDSRLQPRMPTRAAASGPRVGPSTNPFKGLRAFDEDDTEDFFGRDRLVADVIRRLADQETFVALVGPSGSGKSSVARAGLIPAIRKGAVRGSDRWLIAQMVPGAHPFAEFEAAVLRSSIDAPDSLAEQLASSDDTGLLRAALRVLPSDTSRLLLVIDQFEELFTLVDDEALRQRFLNQLMVALDDPHGRVVVLLTLRADFYDRPLAYPEFGSRLGNAIVNVVPMTPDELEAAAVVPAERNGALFEPALLATLIADVMGQPGALPLFQYTLTELFDRQLGGKLSTEMYQAIGGVNGALTRRADDLFSQLDEEQQSVARQLFLRLVAIAESDEWSRRRVHASELLALDVDVVAMQQVIELFGKHRLLSFDRDQITQAPTVEVAHEALLTEWERLREWIEEAREDVQRHAKLTLEALEWREADREPGFLLTDTRLDRYEAWAASTTMGLTELERRFIDASVTHRSEQEEAETEREQRRRRTVLAAAALVVGLGVLGLLLFLRVQVVQGAEEERRAEALLGTGRLLTPQQPELAAIALTESYALRADPRTIAAMGDILMGSQRPETFTPEGGSAALAIHPGGSSLAVGTGTGDVLILGLPSFDPIGEPLEGLTGSVRRVAFSRDGTTVAGVDDTGALFAWETETGMSVLEQPSAYEETLRGLAFLPATGELVTAGRDGRIVFWNIGTSSTKEIPATLANTGLIDADNPVDGVLNWQELAAHPTKPILATTTFEGDIAWWNAESLDLLAVRPDAHDGAISAASFTDDGRLLTAGVDQLIRVWDETSGQLEVSVAGHTDVINSIAIDHRSRLVATGGADQIRFWRADEAGLTPLPGPSGNTAAASSLALGPRASTMVATNDKVLRLFDTAPGRQLNEFVAATGDEVWSLDSDAAGDALVVVSTDDRRTYSVELWDATLSSLEESWQLDRATWFARSRDGSRLAVSRNDGVATVIDLDTRETTDVLFHKCGDIPARPGSEPPACRTRALAWSADGRHLASVASNDERISILNAESGSVRDLDAPSKVELPRTAGRTRPRHLGYRAVIFTDSGRLISGGNDGAIRVWNPDTGEQLDVEHEHDLFVYDLALSPDGELLVSASEDGTVKVWKAADLELMRSFESHAGAVYEVAFAPDGRYVASVGDDQVVRVWDPTTGEEAARYLGHIGTIRTLTFVPESERLLSGGLDGTIWSWDVDWPSWPDRLCDWMRLPVDEGDWTLVMGDEPFDPTCSQ